MNIRALPAFFVLLVAGCAGGRAGLADVGRPIWENDRELHDLLGDYPSPGPNASSEIHDAAGHVVAFPRERAHYADHVVAYEVGSPAPVPEGQDAEMALGPPDYTADKWGRPRAVSLGNGGSLTLSFGEGALIDGDGPDLFIWEIGPKVEAMNVDISVDGVTWIAAGTAPGGACAVDIAPYAAPGEVYRFVRLRDVPFQGAESDSWPGADIDAVAVLGSARRVAVPSEVLFAFDSDALGERAPAELDRLVDAIRKQPGARVTVEGHTDDVGTDEYNRSLSERRAQAVAAYLVQKGIAGDRITARGLGKSRPAGPNDGDQGRRRNRRVEIVIQER
jgi:outer membrane protein OmpA-like peptidoglycan-associated protein